VELINPRFSNLASKTPGAQRQGSDGSIQVPSLLYPTIRVSDPIKFPENVFSGPGVGTPNARRETSMAAMFFNNGVVAGPAYLQFLGVLSPGIWHVTVNWLYLLNLGAAAVDPVHKVAISWLNSGDTGLALPGAANMNIFEYRRVATTNAITGRFDAEFSLETDMAWTANADVQPAAGAGYEEFFSGHFLAQRVF
jgi:hypothetical protein